MDSTPNEKVSVKQTADALAQYASSVLKQGLQPARDRGHKRMFSVALDTIKSANQGAIEIATRDPTKIQNALESVSTEKK